MSEITNTNSHDITQKKPLTHPQIRAITMRFEGLTFLEISKKLEIPLDTIKGWFRRGEPVYGAYKRYSDAQAYQIGKDALLRLRKQIGKAVDTIDSLMSRESSEAIRLRASVFVIEKVTPIVNSESDRRGAVLEHLVLIKEKLGIEGEELDKYFDVLDELDQYT